MAVRVAARGHSVVSTRLSAREALGAVPVAADQLVTSAHFVMASPDAMDAVAATQAAGDAAAAVAIAPQTPDAVACSPDARQQHPSSSVKGGHVVAPPRPRKVVPAAQHAPGTVVARFAAGDTTAGARRRGNESGC